MFIYINFYPCTMFQGTKNPCLISTVLFNKKLAIGFEPICRSQVEDYSPCAILPSPYSAIILQLEGHPTTAWNRRFTHCKLSKHIKLWGAWKACTSTPDKLSAQSISVLLVRRPYKNRSQGDLNPSPLYSERPLG